MTHQVRCTVCLHPRVADADAMTRAGKKDPEVGRALGLSTDAVRRHRIHDHVAPAPSSSAPGGPPSAALDPLADLEAQRADLSAMDVSKMSANQRTQIFELRRKVSVEIAKMTTAPSLAESELAAEYRYLRDVQLATVLVLDRYPTTAKAEVAEAVAALRTTDPRTGAALDADASFAKALRDIAARGVNEEFEAAMAAFRKQREA